MPRDYMFPPGNGVNRTIELTGNGVFSAAMLGCMVLLNGHVLTLETDGATNGFFIACGAGQIAIAGEDNIVVSATQSVFVAYAGGSFRFIEQPDVDLAAFTAHIEATNNPHQVTKAQVGLGNVANTADADKPVSTAQQAAINLAKDRANHTGTQDLASVAGLDDALDAAKDRANHTGTQAADTVSGLADLLAAKVPLPLVRTALEGPPLNAVDEGGILIGGTLDPDIAGMILTPHPVTPNMWTSNGLADPPPSGVWLILVANTFPMGTWRIYHYLNGVVTGKSWTSYSGATPLTADWGYATAGGALGKPVLTAAATGGTAAEKVGQFCIVEDRCWQCVQLNPVKWVELARADTVMGI